LFPEPKKFFSASVWTPEDAHAVRFLRVAHHLDGPSEHAQHRERELGLLGRAPKVAVGVDEHHRPPEARELGRRREA